MAQIKLTQPRAFGGVDYFPGTAAVTVPDDAIAADRWFYDACVMDGTIIELEAPAVMDGAPRKATGKKTPAVPQE